MFSVGLSISPCNEYDQAFNSMLVRMSYHFLDQDMQVVLGHDWRSEDTMRMITNYAMMLRSRGGNANIVSAVRTPSTTAAQVEGESEGALKLINMSDLDLTKFRQQLTLLLDPGCRICLGGRKTGYQGNKPGIIEEAELAIENKIPLFVIGGFGGAAEVFVRGEFGESYWESSNGLTREEKRSLFEELNLNSALDLISYGIRNK